MATIKKEDELYSFDVPEATRDTSGHTIYRIVLQVTPKDLSKNSYQIVYLKRYNDIRKFYDVLHDYHKAIYRPGKFPDFTDKPRFMERYDAAIAEQRRIATKTFLNYAVEHLYLRTYDAYLKFFQNGEKILQPDDATVTLQPEIITQKPEVATDTMSEPLPKSINEPTVDSTQDLVLLTTDEQEQIERVTSTCLQLIEDLRDLQFEQQEEINREKEEFELIQAEVNEATELLSLPLSTTTHKNNGN